MDRSVNKRTAARQGGFAYLEVIAVVGVIALFSSMIVEALQRYSGSQGYYRGQAKARSVADRIMESVIDDANRAVRVFRDDDVGRSYLASLEVGSWKGLIGSLLPAGSNRGYMTRDEPDATETGNALLMACVEGPLLINVGSRNARFDRVVFVEYALTEAVGGGLDIWRWESVAVARYQELQSMTDALERETAMSKLAANGVEYAWDPSPNATIRFYAFGFDGALTPLSSSFRIPRNDERSIDGMAAATRFRVAPNNAPIPLPVPFYALAENGFPHGFEVKIDGDGTGRMIALRLVLVGANGQNHAEAGQLVTIREE